MIIGKTYPYICHILHTGKLIHEEVEEIVEKDPTMSVDQCVQLCDDLFPMSNAENEMSTDKHCKGDCEW